MKNYYRFEMNIKLLSILATILFIIGYIILYLFGFNLWNFNNNSNIFIYIFIWFLLHEVIHGIGFYLLEKKDRKKIVYGIELEKGIFYCMCKQIISKTNILLALLLPLIIIGFITLIVGIVINSNTLLFLSLMNISGSSGDIVMALAIIRMKKIKYLDTDDTSGFYILSNDDIMNKQYVGLKVIEKGSYDSNKIYPKDFTKIKITKKSWYFMIGLLILTIILNLLKGSVL